MIIDLVRGQKVFGMHPFEYDSLAYTPWAYAPFAFILFVHASSPHGATDLLMYGASCGLFLSSRDFDCKVYGTPDYVATKAEVRATVRLIFTMESPLAKFHSRLWIGAMAGLPGARRSRA